jgi:2-(1,2-epoxy-1,2-dihydrophenyl)acetyl-CoA isomerase
MDDNPVLVEKREGYRVITLNRPQRLNAFNEPMQQALVAAVAARRRRTLPRPALTGTGRAFSSGQDLSERINAAGEVTVPGAALEQYYNPLVRKLAR